MHNFLSEFRLFGTLCSFLIKYDINGHAHAQIWHFMCQLYIMAFFKNFSVEGLSVKRDCTITCAEIKGWRSMHF